MSWIQNKLFTNIRETRQKRRGWCLLYSRPMVGTDQMTERLSCGKRKMFFFEWSRGAHFTPLKMAAVESGVTSVLFLCGISKHVIAQIVSALEKQGA